MSENAPHQPAAADRPSTPPAPAPLTAPRRRFRRLKWVAAVLIVVVGVLTVLRWRWGVDADARLEAEIAESRGRYHRVRSLVEKPRPSEARSDLAVMGRYVLTPDVFAALRRTAPGALGEIQLTDGIAALLEAPYGPADRPALSMC